MILKLITHQKPNFKGLLQYMTRETGQLQGKNHQLLLTHNIKNDHTLFDIELAYVENDVFRKQRKRGVAMYHEIISFHKSDSHHLSPEKLQDLSRQYISLRGDRAIYTIFIHSDKDHVHLHSLVSGNLYKDNQATRLSLERLKRLKRDLQSFQVEKYPELEKSVVNYTASSKVKATNREYNYKVRTGQKSQKEKLIGILERCFSTAKSQDDFYDQVTREGIELYKRNGKITGVRFGRKYRLNRLGFGPEHLLLLDREQQRLVDLREKRKNSNAYNRDERSDR
ncbi:MAG: relaxase/mobilization nuclease domain-containing protein [Bacteroidetes bacterium]|nr:relaxase/mobilization nuclease domain-containing protein [Bacteroidota bacterium]